MRDSYYFTLADRKLIAELWEDYRSAAYIARILEADPSTIHRELKRGNDTGELDANKRLKYDPELAQLRFQRSLRNRGHAKEPRKPTQKKPRSSGEES